MRQYLLPKNGNFYKTNLHVHTTVSDGKMTPAEAKELYKSHGYSILAMSDHGIMHPHPELCDEDFLVITAAEGGMSKGDYNLEPTTHFNLYAKDPECCTYPTFYSGWITSDTKKVSEKYKKKMMSFSYGSFEYGTEEMNRVIAECNEAGFLVCYNHPMGSLENYGFYGGLKGLWAVECYNGNSAEKGYTEDMRAIDDILREGERNVFPVASDDAHRPEGCFRGYIMLKAEALEYGKVMEALERGDFYASTGVDISELYIENGVLHIECDGADEIFLRTPIRYIKRTKSNGNPIRSWDVDINDLMKICRDNYRSGVTENTYFRLDIKREDGAEAHTKAFFLDEIQRKEKNI